MMREERVTPNIKKWRMTSALLATFVLSASLSLPVWGDSVEKRVLTLQKGSSVAMVNDKTYTIAKPYIKQGAIMVPVGVFKKAFGSIIKLEGNSRIRIMQGPHVVVMSMESSTAWVDGKKIMLPVEPQMVSGTLMVPLRPVAQGLGAKVNKDKNGKLSISLVVTDKEEASTNTSIDSTAGKTKIGNSYYDWSMNYPSGMVIGSGTDNESIAVFSDATGRYYLEVHATPQQVKLEPDDLLQRLEKDARSSGDVLLDRETVTNAPVPYARIVSRDPEGILWEGRAYYANNKMYGLYFADGDALHYTDLEKYAGLLNSFKPSFNKSDKSLKDLSSIENGLRSIMNTDYGIMAGVPASWSINDQEMFYGDEENGYLSIRVTSAPKGPAGTLHGWTDQMKNWIEEAFIPGSYEIVSLTPIEISGEKGQIQEVRYNFGDGWTTEYEVMVQQNGYRYYLEYTVPEGKEETAKAWDDVLKSIYIDYEAVTANFGRIGEEEFLMDKSKIAIRNSNGYRYSVAIPRYWTAISDRFESSRVEYGFVGGSFEITADKETEAEYVISGMKQYYNEAVSSKSKVKLLNTENISFAGVPAVSFTSHHEKNDIGYTARQIVFENSGITYTISTVINDANATEAQKQAIEKALTSFQLVK